MERFLGLQYPLVKTPRGIMSQKKGVNQIKADLLQLLLTNPGERVMMPQWGTPLNELLFEPNDLTLEIRARQMIANSIERWEPRVVIENITISSNIDESDLHPEDTGHEAGSALIIKIDFVDPENISQIESLVIERPLGA